MLNTKHYPPGLQSKLALITLLFCVPPMFTRITVLLDQPALFQLSDFRGFFSDFALTVCLLVATYAIAPTLNRFVLIAAYLGLALLYLANLEHIRALDASIAIRDLHFLTDPDFRAGSLGLSAVPLGLIFLLFSLALPLAYLHVRPVRAALPPFILTATALAVGLLIWQPTPEGAAWRQQNLVFENAVSATKALGFFSAGDRVSEHRGGTTIGAEFLQSDLNGEKRYVGQKANVLLVMLEGVSGAHVGSPNTLRSTTSNKSAKPAETTRILSERAETGLQFTHVVAPQTQTNRGEYALLCGDIPNQSAPNPKMEIAQHIMGYYNRRCLPKILADQGYHTVYLQAAGMGFMNKDLFMPVAGFEEAYGKKWFKKPYFEHPWGVGDFDFFQQTIAKIEELDDGERSWFLALLTVGTHHNYAVPEAFRNSERGAFEDALGYLDHSLNFFLEELEEKGILRNTLVIITSDESRGSAQDRTRITKNWIPLLVIDQGSPTGLVSETFFQWDIPISVLDYLNLANVDGVPPGRSIFRSYDARRPVIFSRYHERVINLFTTDNTLVSCDADISNCSGFRYPDAMFLWSPPREPTAPELDDVAFLERVVHINDWDFEQFSLQRDSVSAEHGWLAEYFLTPNLVGKSLTKFDAAIEFNWGGRPPLEGIPSDRYSVRWQTCYQADSAGVLELHSRVDDGNRILVNGELVLDCWKGCANQTKRVAVDVQAGAHHIVIEFREDYGAARANVVLFEMGVQKDTFERVDIKRLHPPLQGRFTEGERFSVEVAGPCSGGGRWSRL